MWGPVLVPVSQLYATSARGAHCAQWLPLADPADGDRELDMVCGRL
jgi:hypothetical protein